jgi:hypothetical protein
MIQRLLSTFKQLLAARLARLAVRLARPLPEVWATPPSPPPGDQEPNLGGLPPFTGTAEEAHLLWSSPPVALFRKKQLTGVQPDGSIPEAVEFLKLTAVGKILARVDHILCDDFGASGLASDLKRCHLCSRFSFQAIQPCPACGHHVCPSCAESFDHNGVVLRVCGPCKEALVLARDNWVLPSPPTQQSPPNPV